MELAVYRPLWGCSASPADAVVQTPTAVYDGVEAELPASAGEREELAAALAGAGLGLVAIFLVPGETPAAQLAAFRTLADAAAGMSPDRIVAHSGRDFWSPEEALGFYAEIAEIEAAAGISVAHETHRSRVFATPWATAAVLEQVPSLRLCCDFSHWVVVAERLLEDQGRAVELAASRAIHVHARVGNTQSPQVEDPASVEVAAELETFERWWDLVWDRQEAAGVELSTVTPEYGPPPYQPLTGERSTLPQRLTEVREWQAKRIKARFASRAARR